MGDSLGRAFNPSILFMMAMPFLLIGSMVIGLVFAYRRAQYQTDGNDQSAATVAKSSIAATQVGDDSASTQIQ